MIDLENCDLPSGLAERINKDYIYMVTTILRDKPVYLSNLLLDLDKLIELPENERQDPLKQILTSIQYKVDEDEDAKIII